MSTRPPELPFAEPDGDDDGDAWVRLFERLLVEKLIRAGLRVAPS